jgi:hypothetical protein
MFTRIAVAAFSVVVMAASDDTPKDTSAPAASTPKVAVCRGLSEAECSANDACSWKAEKNRCKKTESDDPSPQESAPAEEDKDPSR